VQSLNLTQGQHILRFSFDSSSQAGDIGNLNWIELTKSPAPAQAPRWPSSWQTAAAAPTGRFEAAGTVVGSKIFVFGGFKSDFSVHRTYTSYNTATNSWTNLGTMPIDMAESHQALAADGQFIYIAGGFGGNLNTSQTPSQWISNKVWRYDTIDNTFIQIATLPQSRGAGSMDLLGRELHYFGGNPADRVTNVGDHFVYNIDNRVWSTAAPMPDPKDHFSSVVLNGKIYALGGEHGHDQLHQQQSDLDVYDPATNAWTSLTSLPIAKSHIEGGTFVLDGKIVMAGGQIDNFQPTANVIAYDPATNSWTTLFSLPAARQGAIVRAVGNAVYVTLGGTQTNSPQSNTWVGQLPAPTVIASAAVPSAPIIVAKPIEMLLTQGSPIE
jgi:N-acetylneuraminic acid mutarotase